MPIGLQVVGHQNDDLGTLQTTAWIEDLLGLDPVAPRRGWLATTREPDQRVRRTIGAPFGSIRGSPMSNKRVAAGPDGPSRSGPSPRSAAEGRFGTGVGSDIVVVFRAVSSAG